MGNSTILMGRVKEKKRLGPWKEYNGLMVYQGNLRNRDALDESLSIYEGKKVLITITEVYDETKHGMQDIVDESKGATGWWFNAVWLKRHCKHHTNKKYEPEKDEKCFPLDQLKSRLRWILNAAEEGHSCVAARALNQLNADITDHMEEQP